MCRRASYSSSRRRASVGSPIHTADADATQLSRWVELRRVGGVKWTHPSQSWRANYWIIVRLLRLVTSDDRMTSLFKKLPISIYIHVVKPLCSVCKCPPNPLAVVVSQLRIVFTPPTPTRRYLTVESRRRLNSLDVQAPTATHTKYPNGY